MTGEIVDFKERLRRRREKDGDPDFDDFASTAEFMYLTSLDIVWLAGLAKGTSLVGLKHNFTKRQLAAEIAQALRHLQSECEELQRCAEHEEPEAAS